MKYSFIALFILCSFCARSQEIMSLHVQATDSTKFIVHPIQLQVRELSVNLDSNRVELECTTIDRGDYDSTKYKSFTLQWQTIVEMDIPTYMALKQAYRNEDYSTLDTLFQSFYLKTEYP